MTDFMARRGIDWYIDRLVQTLVFIGGISAIILGLMAAPIMTSIAEDALKAVPDRYREAAVALEGVSLQIRENEIFGIIGPANAGKTSFLKAVNRMDMFTSGMHVNGDIHFTGRNVRRLNNVYAPRSRVGVVFPLPVGLPMTVYDNERLGYVRIEGRIEVSGQNIYDPAVELVQVRKQIGMVFQRPNPLPISIRDNILFGYKLHMQGKGGKRDEIVEQALRQVLLWEKVKDKLNRKATELSLEEQQKLCIARLLPVKPELLPMDEPCSALDPKGSEAVEELIWELRGEYSILNATSSRLGGVASEERKDAFHLPQQNDLPPPLVTPCPLRARISAVFQERMGKASVSGRGKTVMPLVSANAQVPLDETIIGDKILSGCLLRDRAPPVVRHLRGETNRECEQNCGYEQVTFFYPTTRLLPLQLDKGCGDIATVVAAEQQPVALSPRPTVSTARRMSPPPRISERTPSAITSKRSDDASEHQQDSPDR